MSIFLILCVGGNSGRGHFKRIEKNSLARLKDRNFVFIFVSSHKWNISTIFSLGVIGAPEAQGHGVIVFLLQNYEEDLWIFVVSIFHNQTMN